jgi:hypothetical protein
LKDWSLGVNVAIEGLLEERLLVRVEIMHSALFSFIALYNSTVNSLQNSFSRLVMISVITPNQQIHLVKIAFATVSGVLSKWPLILHILRMRL